MYCLVNAFFRVEVEEGSEFWTLGLAGTSKKFNVRVYAEPMKLEFYSDGMKVAVFNGRSTLKFEHLRKKPEV
jgi:hypothetical protein